MANYTFLSELGLQDDPQKLLTAACVFGGLIAVGAIVGKKLSTKEKIEQAVVPPEKVTMLGFLDFFTEAFIGFHDQVLGKENRKYLGFTGSLFLFLLAANFLGLVPGMAAITTSVQVNVGIALGVFVFFNFLAVKNQGIKGYFKHLCGPMPALAILIFPVEVFGLLLRPITLNLRMYWNVSADHIVLGVFTNELGFGLIGLPFYILGTFVSFMQAFIFTTLTMVYILFAVQHEEH